MNGFWDERYAEAGYAYGTEPNAFLAAQRARLRPGMKALAVADGEGRNGVWLAQQGLAVRSVDASAVGLAKARALAQARGTAIETVQADLTTWEWPVDEYDAVVAIFAHFRPEQRARLHARMVTALRPGGIVILEAFSPAQLQYSSGGPRDPEMLYTTEMLRADFRAAKILLLEEARAELDEGVYHRGTGAVVRMVARRTLPGD